MMRLKEFLALEEVEATEGDLDKKLSGLAYDSRAVDPGTVFFAIPGERCDGHDFIPQALERGAAAVVAARSLTVPPSATLVRVRNVRRAMGLWSGHFFDWPSRRLKLIGVTGTNGKTTVTYLVEAILSAAGMEPGVIGTINYRYRGRQTPSHHTTPESLDLEKLLAQMRDAGVGSVAMEVSSHALAQERVRGLDFDVAVFTNLSRDHLDYHADMEDYFLAKSRLFTDYLMSSAKPRKAAVIYGEDPRGKEIIERLQNEACEVWSYGEGREWDIHPEDVRSDVRGLSGRLRVRGEPFEFASALVGAANLQNLMGAAAVGFALGISAEAVARGIEQLTAVPGRLEKVDNAAGLSVLIDYAHTPDALEKVLAAVRALAGKRVITVFGCGGDRDRGKRPLMGEIAARLSELVVLTSDNPRTEEPLSILREIETGVRKTGLAKLSVSAPAPHGYWVEPDRRQAIRLALGAAAPGDLILIAGKGHEDYQILGTRKIHFDDREVARGELERIQHER